MKKNFKQYLLLSLTAASVLATAPVTYAQETTPPSTTTDSSVSNSVEQILSQENPVFENTSVTIPTNLTIEKTAKLNESSLVIPKDKTLTIENTGKLASHNKLKNQQISVCGTLNNKGTISLDYDGVHKNEDGDFYTELLVKDGENDTPAHFNSMSGSTLTTTNPRAVVKVIGKAADANLTDTNIDNVVFNSADGATINIKNTDKSKIKTNVAILRTIANGKINLENVSLTSPKNEELMENDGSMDQKGQYTEDFYNYHLDEYSRKLVAEILSGNEELLNILESNKEIPKAIDDKLSSLSEEERAKYDEIYKRILDNKLTDEEYGRMKKVADIMSTKEPGQITIKNSDVDTKGFIEAFDKGTITFRSDDNSNKYKVLALNAIQDGQIIIDGGTLEVEKFIGSFNSEKSILKDADRKPGHIVLQKGTLKAPNLRELFADKLIKEYLPKVMKKEEDIKEAEADIDKRYTDKILVLKDNGVIETVSDQIFANKADKAQAKAGELTNNYIDYQGGNIVFDDPEYTDKYLEDIAVEKDKKGAKSRIAFSKTSKLYKLGETPKEPTEEKKESEDQTASSEKVDKPTESITEDKDKTEPTKLEAEVITPESKVEEKETADKTEPKKDIINEKLELKDKDKYIPADETLTIGEKGQILSSTTEGENYINVKGTLINNGVISLDYQGEHKYDNGEFYTSLEIINNGENEAQLISNPGSTIKTSNARAVVRVDGEKASAILTDTNLDKVIFNVANGASLTINNAKDSKAIQDYSLRTIGAATVNIENAKIGKAEAKFGENGFSVEQFGAYTTDYYEHHISEADSAKLGELLGNSDILSVIENKETSDKYDLLKQFADEKNSSTKANVVIKNSDIITDDVLEASDGGTLTLQSENNNNTYKVAGLNAIQEGKIIIDGGNLEVTKYLGSSTDANILREKDMKSGKIILQRGTLTAHNLREITDVNLVQEHLQKLGEQKIAEIPASYVETKKKAKEEFEKGLKEFKEALAHRFTDKVLVLKDEGTIKTMSDQIFANKADEKQEKAGKLTNNFIDYQGGTIVFNDKAYTDKYLADAIKEKNQVGAKSKIKFGEGSKLYKTENNKVYELVTEQTLKDAAKYNGKISIPQPVKIENKATEKPITKVVIGDTKGKGIASTEGKNLQASKLILPSTVSDLSIEADKTLRIGGYTDGKLVETANKKVVATVDGTVTIGEAGLKQKNNIINVNIKGTGKLVVSNAKVTVDKENRVDLSAMKVDIVNNGTLELAKESTILGKDTKINVGDKGDNGILKVSDVNLNGATILLDPVFKDGQKYSEAYIAPKNGELDGKVIVGRNSILVLGSTDTAKAEAFDKFLSADADKYGAGVYVAAPTIVTGSLKIDKTATDAKNPAEDKSVEIANNSLVIIGAEALVKANGEKAALTAEKVVLPAKAADTDTKETAPAKVFAGDYGAQLKVVGSLADMAKLQDVLAKAKAEHKTVVLVKANNIENELTKPVEFSDLLDLQVRAENGEITLSVKNKDGKIFKPIAEAYKETPVLLANTIDKTIETTLANLKTNKPAAETTPGTEFLNLITNSLTDKTTKALALNSMANMGDLAGITKQSYASLTKFNDAVMNHANDNSDELWAMYINNNGNKVDLDLTNAKASYKATTNGLILGKNLQHTAENTLGVAVFYNKADITADNSSSNTKNDAKGYGLSVYGAKKVAKLNVLANVTYAHNSNDIKQYNAGFMAKAKANTSDYSLGIQAEQPIAHGNNVVTPYAGLRFAHLGGTSFTNSLGFKYEVKAQNLVELPVGLRYESNIIKNNKTIKPYAELGYNALLSGKAHKVTVGLNNGADSFDNTVFGNVWHAKLGVTMETKNNSFSLSYGHYQGKFTKDNQVIAQAKFKF